MKTFIQFISESENTPIEDLTKELKMIHKVILSNGKKAWQGRHYGDCTKQNISCLICVYQDWLAKYEDYSKDFIKKLFNTSDKESIPKSENIKYDMGIKIWNKKSPKEKGDFICRMNDGYIKMCHWDGDKWLDMWDDKLNGKVIEWMNIPYDSVQE